MLEQVETLYEHTIAPLLLPAGLVVIDIGSKDGQWSRACWDRLSPSKLVAYDPKGRTEAWPDIPADVRMFGVGARTETRRFAERADAPQCASAVFTEGHPTTEVSFLAISAVLKEHRPHLVKLDCEGSELEIFGCLADHELLGVQQWTVEFHCFMNGVLSPSVEAIKVRMRKLGFLVIEPQGPWDVLFVQPG